MYSGIASDLGGEIKYKAYATETVSVMMFRYTQNSSFHSFTLSLSPPLCAHTQHILSAQPPLNFYPIQIQNFSSSIFTLLALSLSFVRSAAARNLCCCPLSLSPPMNSHLLHPPPAHFCERVHGEELFVLLLGVG